MSTILIIVASALGFTINCIPIRLDRNPCSQTDREKYFLPIVDYAMVDEDNTVIIKKVKTIRYTFDINFHNMLYVDIFISM